MIARDRGPAGARPVPAWIGDGSRLLLVVLLAYFIWWVIQYAGFLFDPMLQADDARTSLFPLHRFGPERALADDPVADSMLAFMPPLMLLLYRVLIPMAGLLVAAKMVQGLCLMILAGAVFMIYRSRKAGFAAGAILTFLFLHTPLFFERGISGGLPRAFAFPLMMLWFAGAITGQRYARLAAGIVSAATYPPAMTMILAAEGIFLLRNGIDLRSRQLRRKLLLYGVVVLLCTAALIPLLTAERDVGRIHTLEEARGEPAFYRDGRLLVLPFKNPVKAFPLAYAQPLLPARGSVVTGLSDLFQESYYDLIFPLLLTLAGAWTLLRRRSPFPAATVAFFTGSVILYVLARLMAFRMYSPERYYAFTMPLVLLFFLAEVFGRIDYDRGGADTRRKRNLVAVGLIVLVLVWGGDGIVAGKDGMTLDGREHAELYRFASSLPPDVLFASHPLDGDDIPLWAGRSSLLGFETLQPWFIDSWQRQKKTTFELLASLYATRQEDVLDFCNRYGVSHLLLNRERYGSEFRSGAHLFEPFDSFLAPKLADLEIGDLVLAAPPADAVVFESPDHIVLSVARLKSAWEVHETPERQQGL